MVLEPAATAYPNAVQERAVPRQAIVDDRPARLTALDVDVHSRHASIPGQAHVAARPASQDEPTRPVGGQLDDLLCETRRESGGRRGLARSDASRALISAGVE